MPEQNEVRVHDTCSDQGSGKQITGPIAQNFNSCGDSINEGKVIDQKIANYTRQLRTWTAVLSGATIFLGIATGGLWYYASQQARDMKEAIGASLTANKIAVDENRPWIGPPEISVVQGKGICRFYIKFSNIGKTVAKGVHMGVELGEGPNSNFATIHEDITNF